VITEGDSQTLLVEAVWLQQLMAVRVAPAYFALENGRHYPATLMART